MKVSFGRGVRCSMSSRGVGTVWALAVEGVDLSVSRLRKNGWASSASVG